jgi:hypothetical protein
MMKESEKIAKAQHDQQSTRKFGIKKQSFQPNTDRSESNVLVEDKQETVSCLFWPFHE